MEKRLIHSFFILGILAVAGIFIFSYSHLKLTGYDIAPSGCDGNWTSSTSDCVDGNQTITWTSSDTTSCTSPTTQTQTCSIDNSTIENTTSENSSDNSTTQNQTQPTTWCGDAIVQTPNSDGVNEECDDGTANGQACTASYGNSCTYCSSECQTATIHGASCGDGTCNGQENCTTCATDCGVCPEENTTDTNSTQTNSTDQTTNDSLTAANTCTPNWQCGDWQDCVGGTQVRVCADLNNCGSNDGIPETSQSCTAPIQNQSATNQTIQSSRGFFGIMGNVISGSIQGMFGNVTRTVISISVFVLIIGGLVIFRFVYRRKDANSEAPANGSPKDSDVDDTPVDFSKLQKY